MRQCEEGGRVTGGASERVSERWLATGTQNKQSDAQSRCSSGARHSSCGCLLRDRAAEPLDL